MKLAATLARSLQADMQTELRDIERAVNRRAIACYQRAGFAHVGTWPQALKTTVGVIDVYWISITRTGASSAG